MPALAMIGGLTAIALILWDAFETILLPRRVSGPFRIARTTTSTLWRLWAWMARGQRTSLARENLLGLFAMLSMITLLGIWAAGLIVAFALIHWASGSHLVPAGGHASFL